MIVTTTSNGTIMLKFKIKMVGYNIVVPNHIHSWELLDNYLLEFGLSEGIQTILVEYVPPIPTFDGGIIHTVTMGIYGLPLDSMIMLIEDVDSIGYYVSMWNNQCISSVYDMDNDESYFRTLLKQYYRANETLDLYGNKRSPLKEFTHQLILEDRSLRY